MSPIIGIAPCRSLTDYVESVRRAGGEPRVFAVSYTHLTLPTIYSV